jgi:hypothetical protein
MWKRIGAATIISATSTLILSGWFYSRDSFPLLSYWGMYAAHANRPLEWVHYSTVYKVRQSGARERTELVEYFSVLNQARWLDHIGYSSDPNKLFQLFSHAVLGVLFFKYFRLNSVVNVQ